MARPPSDYLAYMLRLWPAGRELGAPWRASLENPYTGERIAFANRETMIAFLEEQIASFERRRKGAVAPTPTTAFPQEAEEAVSWERPRPTNAARSPTVAHHGEPGEP